LSLPGGEVTSPSPNGGGLCLVLGAGAFRGLAHVGVLSALRRASIPIHAIIGASIGSLVGAFYAGLGLEPGEIAEQLSRLSTSSLFALGLALRQWGPLSSLARSRVGTFLEDLERLRELDLERLHFGVRRLGILAMDLPGGEEVFAATGIPSLIPPGRIVLGGISIPGLFPVVPAPARGRTYRLVDGGLSHSVPVERGFEAPFSAAKVLAVDLQVLRGFREREWDRWERLGEAHGDSLLRLLPRVRDVGTIFFRREQAADLVRAGEESVTDEVLAWLTLSPGGC
jgi:NTE family protein